MAAEVSRYTKIPHESEAKNTMTRGGGVSSAKSNIFAQMDTLPAALPLIPLLPLISLGMHAGPVSGGPTGEAVPGSVGH